jgi:lipopolysaccharide export LptBFGC system permease protein LptF
VGEREGVVKMELVEAIKMFWPVLVISLVLAVLALYDLYKRESVRGSKVLWVIIIVLIGTIGPIIYFAVGREK